MKDDVAKVAAGLSEAQREALARRDYGGRDMRKRLAKVGMFIVKKDFWTITNLGLAVRAYLQEQQP
jgi:hypothetical protein